MIIVTGALGFIGSNLVKELNKRGHKNIILVDEHDQKKLKNIEGLEYKSLLSTREFFNSFNDWKKVEIVFHEGAISSTTEKSETRINNFNINPSIKLIDKSIEFDFWLSYASSASVYGGNFDFSESSEIDPKSLYAKSKAVLDKKVNEILEQKPLAKIQGWRYFNVYGNNEHHKQSQASPVFKFSDQAQTSGKILLFEGSENYKRDFICVSDIVRIKVDAWEKKINGIYNLGTGKATSFRKVAEYVSKKYSAEIVEIPFPQELEGQYQIFTKADMRKLTAAMGELKFTEIYEFLQVEDI